LSRTFWRRLWHLLNRPRFERELTREMREHREAMVDPAEFGDLYRHLEASRDAWGWNWLDDAIQDLRQGVRELRQSPGFTVVGVLILAFGISLNLAFYQVATVTLLRPPPIRSPETLVRFDRRAPTSRSNGVPYAVADFVRRENNVLSAVLVQSGQSVVWGDDAVEVEAQFVSANWFDEIGYGPLLGRVFSETVDDRTDGLPGVVISHAFWRNTLEEHPGVVGRSVTIDRRPVVIVGVARPDFPEFELDHTAVWIPIARHDYFYPESDFLRTFTANNVHMFGRLASGVPLTDVGAALGTTMDALALEQPAAIARGEWLEPIPGTDNFRPPHQRRELQTILSLLAGLTFVVLIVAATNLGNLALARASGRARELGVRVALGARRSRIVRQLVVETMPLALLGTAFGLLVAWWATLVLAAATNVPTYLDFTPDWRTVLLSAALLAVCLVIVAALPAWKVARQDLTSVLKDGGQQVSVRLDRARLRRFLVAAQVMGSCLLIAVAGMIGRTAQRALTSDPGFVFNDVARLSLPLSREGITGDQARAYWSSVKERIGESAEAVDLALVTAPPFGGILNRTGFDDAPGIVAVRQTIDPSYFAVMRIPLIAGRTFASNDGSAATAIISRRLALAMYGSLDVLGKGFPRSAPSRTIVGVAADAHTIVVTATDVAEVYTPLATSDYNHAVLIARARSDPARLLPILRLAGGHDSRIMPTVGLLRDDFIRRTRPPRIAAAVVGAIGTLTLLLTSLGIFGVVSYSAILRKKEIGIHLALGASRSVVVPVIIRQTLTPIAAGIAAGLLTAFPAGLVLSSEPFYLSPLDPPVYVIALGILVTTGVTAAAFPALRVLGADPIGALRHE
jgi:predicted permease